MKSLVIATLVMKADRYIVMKPATPMKSTVESSTGAACLKSSCRSCLAHIERMPVEDTSRPPKNSIRCGAL